jgi:hypothetical protein
MAFRKMGSFGSGRRREPRLLVEQHQAIDVYDLYRRGALVHSAVTTLQWAGPPARALQIRADHGRLFLAVNGGLEELVQLGCEPANWGGDRPSFRCPTCGRRCLQLFLMDRITCRICAGLDYASRHRDAVIHQIARLRRELGADPAPFGPLPPRPRGPAAWPYDRLVDQSSRIQSSCSVQPDYCGDRPPASLLNLY